MGYDITHHLGVSFQWLFQEPIGGTYCKAYRSGLCKGISPQNMAKNMLQYLQFRILKNSIHWIAWLDLFWDVLTTNFKWYILDMSKTEEQRIWWPVQYDYMNLGGTLCSDPWFIQIHDNKYVSSWHLWYVKEQLSSSLWEHTKELARVWYDAIILHEVHKHLTTNIN